MIQLQNQNLITYMVVEKALVDGIRRATDVMMSGKGCNCCRLW
jgi:S-adenosylhomocysteine hydrolase